MKKYALFLLGASLLVSAVGHSQINLPTFEELCEYDGACRKVGRVKKGRLVVKPIDQIYIDYYKRLRNVIIQIANEYDIDPVTLVLTPLAENTMNVDRIDEIQDELVRNGSAPEGVFLGVEMSFGPGQIYTSTAKRVEDLAAQIERRPKRSKREITSQLITPEGALRYAAAILRQAQDIYAENGYDISRRPEILSTIYNIGKPERRVKNTVRERREPYPNYFGYFVGYNYRYIQQKLNLPSVLDEASQ